MPATKTATMWQQLSKIGGERHSKQQETIAMHMMSRNTNGDTEKITKTIVKTVETKDTQTSILHNQKIALHKSLLKKQEKQEKQNESAHHPT